VRTRVLPREEWGRLDTTKHPEFWSYVRPEDIEIVVVEDGQDLIASAAVMRSVCIEGLWIEERFRGNAGIARRLGRAVLNSARRWSDFWAFGAVGTEHMHDIMRRLGGKQLPVSVYMLSLKDREEGTRCA